MFKEIRSGCARTLAVLVWFTCAAACNLAIAQTNSSPPGHTPSWVPARQKESPSSTQPAGDTANRTPPLAAAPNSARLLSQNASTGERRDYYDTSLTACPSGEQLIYFWYYQDIPELRGQSWCGAAQADLDYANATDPYRWRIPYLMDSCQAGVNWRYSHAFQDGTRYHSPPYREINLACRVEDLPPEPTPTPEAPQGCQAGPTQAIPSSRLQARKSKTSSTTKTAARTSSISPATTAATALRLGHSVAPGVMTTPPTCKS